MKNTHRILITSIAAAIALPFAAFAAKGERKKTEAAPAFATVDKDSNGSVNQAEFVAAMKEKLGEDAAKTQFASLDKDSDGKLTKEEFAAAAGEKKKRKKKNAE